MRQYRLAVIAAVIVSCICTAFALVQANSGEFARPSGLHEDLDEIIRRYTETREDPNQINRADLAQEFKQLHERRPGSLEGEEARMWASVLELEAAQGTNDREELQRRSKAVRAKVDAAFGAGAKQPWVMTIIKFLKASTYILERDWPAMEGSIKDVLEDLKEPEISKHPRFVHFWEARGVSAEEIEPEVRFLLVISNSLKGDFAEAIRWAEAMKKQFPSWSERAGMDGVILLLNEKRSPFKLP